MSFTTFVMHHHSVFGSFPVRITWALFIFSHAQKTEPDIIRQSVYKPATTLVLATSEIVT